VSKGQPITKATARTQSQKERILAAAQECFVKSGFHAASMATIARTAGMSPGLIYRYFENKNAIILAIIDQQLEVARRRIRALHSSGNLAKRILDYLDEPEIRDDNSMNTALYLEISAQATRDPQIAEALRRYDITVCSELEDWFRRDRDSGGYGLPDEVVPARALILLCLIEGLKLRGAREPETDRKMLMSTLAQLLDSLVSPPV
jgi:AcrR family transcriptional regulator